MTDSQDLRAFFDNAATLCKNYSRRQFPAEARNAFNRWIESSLSATREPEFFSRIENELLHLRERTSLGELIIQELSAVVILQHAAINIPGFPFNDEEPSEPEPDPKPERIPPPKLTARAIRATKSLLSSLREFLKDLVPAWILGILKIFEEMTEILGPSK